MPRELVEELARLLWEAYRGRRITLDARGRPNYMVVRAFAGRLLGLARRYGVEDPLHEIDWVGVLDPDISREENLRRLDDYLAALGRRPESPAEELDETVSELERYLSHLREELGRAPPEARPSVEEEIRRVEAQLEELRRARRPGERRARPPRRAPPRRPAAPPPPPPAPLPVEELRARVEYWLRRIPRVYRIDWLAREPYKARVSCHRGALEEVRRTVEEWGGRVERVVEARPPLVILYADFSGARPPPVPVAPGLERYILWSKFSAALLAAGISPEEHRAEFERVLAETGGLPLEERQRRVEELARRIVSAARPPPPAPPRELLERLERIERELRELREAAAWRPRAAEEIRAVAEALWMPEPRAVLRVDERGHPFWGPDDRCMEVLCSILDRWACLYFSSCPLCRYSLPGGALSPTEFVEHLIRKERAVPPLFVEWLRRLARRIEEMERGAAT